MKDAAMFLPRYLLTLVAVLAVLFAFTILVSTGINGQHPSTVQHALRSILLPSVIASLFLSFFYSPVRPFPGLVTTALAATIGGVILVFGFTLSDRLCEGCATPDATFPLIPGRIERVESGAVYLSSAQPTDTAPAANGEPIEVSGIVRFVYAPIEPVVVDDQMIGPLESSYFSQGVYLPEIDVIDVGDGAIPINPTHPAVSPLMTPPAFLGRMFEEISSLTMTLVRLRNDSMQRFMTAVFALTAFASSCVVFARLSRWNLINIAITVFMIRGVFLLYRLFASDLVTDLVGGGPQMSQLPALAFAALAALLVLVRLVFSRSEAQ